MGSGKSTVGAQLAELLGRSFVDLDAELVRRERHSIADIFSDHGEAHFRSLESSLLKHILEISQGPSILALGGGTFIQPANRELLRSYHALTVYLDAEFDVLESRCCHEVGVRPLMQDPVRFRRLFEERRPIYRSAEIIVSVGDRTPEEVAAEIVSTVARSAVSE